MNDQGLSRLIKMPILYHFLIEHYFLIPIKTKFYLNEKSSPVTFS